MELPRAARSRPPRRPAQARRPLETADVEQQPSFSDPRHDRRARRSRGAPGASAALAACDRAGEGRETGERHRSPADLARRRSTTRASDARAPQQLAQPLGARPQHRRRLAEQPHGRESPAPAVPVQLEGRLQRGHGHLVDPQRAVERVRPDALDQRRAPDDDARLRAAEQLVAREGDHVGARGDHRAHGRLRGQPLGVERDQRRPSPDPRTPARRRARAQLGELARRHLLGEADQREVRAVHLHQQRRCSAVSAALVVGAAGCGWWCPPRPAARPTGASRRARGSRRRSPPARRARRSPRGPAPARESTSSTAAALLLTTSASSAPVSSREQLDHRRVAAAALALVEVVLEVGVAAATSRTRSTAAAASGARPRLVCSTTPVALSTGRRLRRGERVAAPRATSVVLEGRAPRRAAAGPGACATAGAAPRRHADAGDRRAARFSEGRREQLVDGGKRAQERVSVASSIGECGSRPRV